MRRRIGDYVGINMSRPQVVQELQGRIKELPRDALATKFWVDHKAGYGPGPWIGGQPALMWAACPRRPIRQPGHGHRPQSNDHGFPPPAELVLADYPKRSFGPNPP